MPSLSIERERQARREVGVTAFSRGVKGFLCAFFIAAVAGGTLWHLAADLGAGSRAWPRMLDPTRLLPAPEEIGAVRTDAGWRAALKAANDRVNANIADYETDLEDRSPVIAALVPAVNSLVSDVLGGSTESVYRGRNGWWFFRSDIDYVTGRGFLDAPRGVDEERSRNPLPALTELHRSLAARGIELVVAPVPVKPSIHPERFSGRYEGAGAAAQNPSYASFLSRMEAAGIGYVDLTKVLWRSRGAAPLFLATDTHWSPAGLGLAAKAVAEAVRRLGIAWAGPPMSYLGAPLAIAGKGDTVAMLELADAAPEAVTAERVFTAAGALWTPDAGAEILLLGDSFANIYADPNLGWGSGAGLAAQLSAELARPVDALAVNDNGSYAARAALAADIRRGRDRLAVKKVVIYEFACRELAFGDWRTGFAYGPEG